MPQERRQHARIAFNTPARLLASGRTFNVEVLDLSLKGALIRLPNDASLAIGDECLLHVPLDDEEPGRIVELNGRLAHVQGAQAGLLCHSIDLDSITHLRRLVELNLGEATLLERELAALIGT